jgi:dipeptide/tripeptide permease
VYLTQVFHMRSVDAATLLNGLNGTTSLAPIVGAFLSDAYLGRYLALAIASIASLIVSAISAPLLYACCLNSRRRPSVVVAAGVRAS